MISGIATEALPARPSWIRRVETAALVALTGLLFLRALDVCTAWDVWDYHLPFAARLVGLVGPDRFVFHAVNQARYDGFPLAVEALQGALYRMTGRPEAANLVSLGALVAYVLWARRRYGIPALATLVALLAVPLVTTHAVGAYVDLPANLAVAALAMHVADAWSGASVRRRDLAFGITLAAFAANAKLLLVPPALLGLGALFARAAWFKDASGRTVLLVRGRARWAALFAVGLLLVLATPLRNVARYGNPAYPVALRIAGVTLPSTEEPDVSTPPYLAEVPAPVRFVVSVAELGIQPLTHPHRWTLDQYMPPASTGHRMGGFFGAYVAFAIVTLVVLARGRRGDRTLRARIVVALVATALTAFSPQSHQLRYYLYVMVLLVTVDLAALYAPVAPGERRHGPLSPLGTRGAFLLGAVLAFSVVTASTRGAYLVPSGYRFEDLVRDKVQPDLLGEIGVGEPVCFYDEPWTFLYTSVYHPGLRHRVREGTSAEACRGDRFLGVR